jgi:CoA:oxalate CoA-transferase
MVEISRLGVLLESAELAVYDDPDSWHERRDEIKALLAETLSARHLADVLSVLEADGVWCSEVLTWPQLVEHDGFRAVDMVLEAGEGKRAFRTTRCPIRIDGEPLASPRPAPRLGEHGPLPVAGAPT